MTNINIENRVVKAINEILGMPKNGVTISCTSESLGLDSLDKVECIMMLEEEFELEISDPIAEGFTNVQSIIEHIRSTN